MQITLLAHRWLPNWRLCDLKHDPMLMLHFQSEILYVNSISREILSFVPPKPSYRSFKQYTFFTASCFQPIQLASDVNYTSLSFSFVNDTPTIEKIISQYIDEKVRKIDFPGFSPIELCPIINPGPRSIDYRKT
jgi:hypothetical protein